MTGESPTTGLIGRDEERRAIDASIDAARRGMPSTLVFVGEPGIGKSALLADVKTRHPDATIVEATGVEAEQSIPFAALTMLVARHRDVLDGVDPQLLAPLRSIGTGVVSAPLSATALALVELLAALGDHGLVLVVLDDLHWFDQSSLAVIEFALRRLGNLPVATIAASRRRDAFDLPARIVPLGPLDRASAQALLGAGGRVAEQVSQRCWDLCGGNPLTLVELSQTLTADQRLGTRPLPELLPVAGRLQSWLSERIDALPAPTRTALGVLALAGSIPTTSLLEALDQLGLRRCDLDAAEDAGVIEIGSAHTTFTHPLFATVAAAKVEPEVRRMIHRVLASNAAESSTERRAWHLVEACETADDVARAMSGLEDLARRATASGAHLAAADAWERLAALRTDADGRSTALTAAGTAAWDAGRPDLAAPLLRTAWDLVPAGPTRAAASNVLGLVVGWSDSITVGRRLLEAEVAHVEAVRPDLAVQLLVSSATLGSLAVSPDAIAVTRRAEEIAQRGDDFTKLAARTIATHVRLLAGEGLTTEPRLAELDDLVALVAVDIDRSIIELAHLHAFGLMVRERWDDCQDAYQRVITAARTLSLGAVETFGLAMSAEVAWRTGRWTRARGDAAADAAFHAPLAGLAGTFGDATLARVEAALGLDADARAHARLAVQRGDEIGMHAMSAWGRHALGLADLAAQAPAEAVVHLEWIWDFELSSGANDPGLLWWQGDLLEALVAVGRLDDARRLVDQLTEQAAATGRRWPEAIAARGRGILDDDPDEVAHSVAILDELDAPFESARSQLVLATLLDGDRARTHLDGVRRVFQRLGATPWVLRCRAVGGGEPAGVDRPVQPSIAARLTPAELRVASAVGAGMSTRDAATSLALSTRTVDAHLRSIFRKLDITSRSQLAVLISASMNDQR
jgi:DNA-binding CsgD family transcriptional regulator